MLRDSRKEKPDNGAISREDGGSKKQENKNLRPLKTQRVAITDIEIGERIRKSLEGIDELAQNIQDIGLLHPVVIVGKEDQEKGTHYQLIAGQRRIAACQKLGWKFIPANIVDLEVTAIGEFSENIFRDQLTPSELIVVWEKVKETRVGHRPSVEEKVKDDIMGGKLSPFSTRGKNREVSSQIGGVSPSTMAKIGALKQAADRDPDRYGHFLDELENGNNRKFNRTFKEFSKVKLEEILGPPPDGEFGIIFIDPVWDQLSTVRRLLKAGSNSISINQAYSLSVPAAKDSLMFFKTDDSHLSTSLKLLSSYNFEFVEDRFVVIDEEESEGSLFATRQHTHLLIGKKGNPTLPPDSSRHSASKTSMRSQVEEEILKSIEAASVKIEGSRLHIFGRPIKRGSWIQWLDVVSA